MKSLLSVLLVLLIILSLFSAAFADSPDEYSLCITSCGKTASINGRKADDSVSGYLTGALNTVISTQALDRSLFRSLTVYFTLSGSSYIPSREELVGHNGLTYVSSDPKVIFIDSQSAFHPVSAGRATLSVTGADGKMLDGFTVSVSEKDGILITEARCGVCGKQLGNTFHLMSCGHFSCIRDELDHSEAPCGYDGHYLCSGEEHKKCLICFGCTNEGLHGEGICEHIHEWEVRTAASSFPEYFTYQYKYCPKCGAVKSVLPDDYLTYFHR